MRQSGAWVQYLRVPLHKDIIKTAQKTSRIKDIMLEITMCIAGLHARDVIAAMLVVKNKSISLVWELNSIFM